MTIPNTDFSVIAALDLDPIKVKLMHEESGEGWSLEQANAVEFEYRRFLYLMKKFPKEGAAPRSDVDLFWHYHILDTIKYAQDCQAVFGYFLHHFPYIGLRGTDDLAAHERVGERMRVLYEDTFGEPFMRGAVAEKMSAILSQTAFSLAPSARAVSASTMGTAFSLATATTSTAFSLATASTAFSLATASTAFSLATASTAPSAAPMSTAFSLATTDAVSPPGANEPGAVWNQHSAGFFTVRPSLDSVVSSH